MLDVGYRKKHPMKNTILRVIGLLILLSTGCDNSTSQHLQEQNETLQQSVKLLQNELDELKLRSASDIDSLRRENEALIIQKQALASKLENATEQLRSQKAKAEAAAKSKGVFELMVVKVYQSGSYTKIDFQVTNKSEHFIDYWELHADIYDSNGQYLGHEMTNGNNLRPSDAATDNFIFDNVNASSVAEWKLRINRVSVGRPGGGRDDKTKDFTLREIQ